MIYYIGRYNNRGCQGFNRYDDVTGVTIDREKTLHKNNCAI